MTDRDRLIELLDATFEKQYKNLVITAPHTADYLIANGVTVGDAKIATTTWRPASEPPKDEYPCVILSAKSGDMLIAQYKPEQRSWAFFANQHLISHWMPLPQPPKEVE